MGMMINRRRVCGGKSLPYDAEIEYLESSGTQYIQTSYIPRSGDNISALVESTQSKWNVYWGSSGADFSQPCGIFRTLTNWCGYFKDNYLPDGLQGTFQRSGNFKGTVWQNSIYFYIQQQHGYNTGGGFTYCTYPIAFFAFSKNGTPVYFSEGLKIYNAQITNGNNIMLDIISVRKGNVGYMYDKVGGQLFGNSGTGSFILGPDK